MSTVERFLAILNERPEWSSEELQTRLGLSQPTVSRLIRRARHQVVKLGKGPNTRYAPTEKLFGTETSAIPIYAVDPHGVVSEIATLRGVFPGRYVVEGNHLPFWVRGHHGDGAFASLPYFLYDLRPSGFLGRRIARRLAEQWALAADPREWNDNQIGRYLLQEGFDVPGNLVLGEFAAQRANRAPMVMVDDRSEAYPRLARQMLGHNVIGSSAAGEQPKFAVYQRDSGHVIVKFSPEGASREARRWQDLLCAEHHALSLLRDRGYSTSQSTVFRFEERLFLECVRFDRCGLYGRNPALSLNACDLEFAGEGLGWSKVGQTLANCGLLSAEALSTLIWLETFGQWIGNTDMHLVNISVAPTDTEFRLLPLYDMLPMAFAPIRGELADVALRPPLRTEVNRAAWESAGLAAKDYWIQLADLPLLSDEFRECARRQHRMIAETLRT